MQKYDNPKIVYKTSPQKLVLGVIFFCLAIGLVFWTIWQFKSGNQISWLYIILGIIFALFGWSQFAGRKDYHCKNCGEVLTFTEFYLLPENEASVRKNLERGDKNFAKGLEYTEDCVEIQQDYEVYLDVHFCYCPNCQKVAHLLSFWRVRLEEREVLMKDKPLN